MKEIKGYQLIREISEGEQTSLVRCSREEDATFHLVYQRRNGPLNAAERVILQYGFETFRELDLYGVLQVRDLLLGEEDYSFILEDFEGIPLEDLLRGEKSFRKVELKSALRMILQISRSLEALHREGFAHGGITPSSFLVNRENGQIRLILIPCENRIRVSRNGDDYKKKRCYLRPEQECISDPWGADVKRDMRALGVLLNLLLTGNYPDPEESRSEGGLVPEEGDVPPILLLILRRLLDNRGGEGYCSVGGVIGDLERCLRQLRETGKIELFTPGTGDRGKDLLFTKDPIGRDGESSLLADSWERVRQGAREFCLIRSRRSSGKRTLARRAACQMEQAGALLLSAVFDEQGTCEPLSELRRLFGNLIRSLQGDSHSPLSEGESRSDELEPYEGVLRHFLPESLSLPETHSAAVPERAWDRRRDLLRALSIILRRSGEKGRPPVLLLEELHRADRDSLMLLQDILADSETGPLLVIATCRENGGELPIPPVEMISALEEGPVTVRHIALEGLGIGDVCRLTASALRREDERIRELAELVHAKTRGYPGMIKEFLQGLITGGILRCDSGGGWVWDDAGIGTLPAAENLEDLQAVRLRRFPSLARNLLEAAACLGKDFHAETLSVISETSLKIVIIQMEQGIREGILRAGRGGWYSFCDGFEETIVALSEESATREMHRRIARHLMDSGGEEIPDASLYPLIRHQQLSGDREPRGAGNSVFASVNERAGRRAGDLTAFNAAVQYLGNGMELLSRGGGTGEEGRIFKLGLYRAECGYASGAVDEAEKNCRALERMAGSDEERLSLLLLRIQGLAACGRGAEAMEAGWEALDEQGMKISRKPSLLLLRIEHARMVWLRFLRNKIPWILRKTGEGEHDALRILEALCGEFPSDERLVRWMMALRALRYEQRAGSLPISPQLYFVASSASVALTRRYRIGRVLFNEAMRRLQGDYGSARGEGFYAREFGGGPLWQEMDRVRENLERHCSLLQEEGRLDEAVSCALSLADLSLAAGIPMGEVFREYRRLENLVQSREGITLEDLFQQRARILRDLAGEGGDESVSSDRMDAGQVLLTGVSEAEGSVDFPLFLSEMRLLYLKGHYQRSMAAAIKCQPTGSAFRGSFHFPEYLLYEALLVYRLARDSSSAARISRAVRLGIAVRRMKKFSSLNPRQFQARYLLLKGLLYGLLGFFKRALICLEASITEARAQGLIHDEALAREFAGEHLWRISPLAAEPYLRSAEEAYARWGVVIKQSLSADGNSEHGERG